MARLFNDGANQYLAITDKPVSVEPLSMVCWFNTDDDAIAQRIVCLSDASGTIDRLQLVAQGNVAGDYMRLQYTRAGGDNVAISTTGYSVNTWHHVCGVVVSNSAFYVFLDGGSKGSGEAAAGINWANVDTTSIGALLYDNTVVTYVSGAVAEVALYNCALTDDEVLRSVKLRYSPLKTRPQNLAAYWSLRHGDNSDWLGRYGMIAVNAPADTAPPPIVYPEYNDPVWGLVLPRYRPRHYWALRPLPIIGSTAWGHVTGVVEDNTRPFDGKWSGTGDVERLGDDEQLALASGEYMESEVVNTGANLYEIDQNVYQAGDDVTVKFRHGATEAACLAAAFGAYVAPFDSLGFVQIRLESTL